MHRYICNRQPLRKRNIKWYLGLLTTECILPETIDYFENYLVPNPNKSAEDFLKEEFEMDIETDKYRLDGEHYIKEVHSKIAKEYFDIQKEQKVLDKKPK